MKEYKCYSVNEEGFTHVKKISANNDYEAIGNALAQCSKTNTEFRYLQRINGLNPYILRICHISPEGDISTSL